MLPRLLFTGCLVVLSVLALPMHDDDPPGGDPFADPGEISFLRAWRAYHHHDDDGDSGKGSVGGVAEALEISAGLEMRDSLEAWAGWLNPWGEGELVIFDNSGNLTIPHRPAAFPARLPEGHSFPISGTLQPILSFPHESVTNLDEYCCAALPATPYPLLNTTTIALLTRGHCSFSHKVRLAQALGAHAVVVGDDIATSLETDEQGRTRTGLLTMYSPDDTQDVRIPATFVSRAGWLVIRDLMGLQGGTVEVRIEPDDGYDWPLSDLLVFIMLLPSVITIFAILLGKYRAMQQRRRDRAPKETVLALPEAVWVPEEWEKEDDSPSPAPASGSAVVSSPGTGTGSGPLRNDGTTSQRQAMMEEQATADDNPGIAVDQAARPAGGYTHAEGLVDANAEEGQEEQRTRSFLGLPKQKPQQSPSSTPPSVAASPVSTTAATTTQSPRKKRKFYSKDECAICLGSFERGDVIRILPCGHLFHKLEVDDWLVKWKKVCPVCRMDITATPSDPTLMIPAHTATTPLTAGLPAPGTNVDVEQDTARWWWDPLEAWGRLRAVFPYRRAQGAVDMAREEGEETPLLRD